MKTQWVIKVRGEEAYFAIQRWPEAGFTTCSKKGNPGVYDPQFFTSKAAAKKELASWPKKYGSLASDHGKWEVTEWKK